MKTFSFFTCAVIVGIGTCALGGQSQAAPFDQSFIDAMVPHHSMAVEMGQIAAKRAHFPEVRRMAAMIVRDQQKEIAQMKHWRQAWYGGGMSTGNTMAGSMQHTMGGHSVPGMMKDAHATMSPGMLMGLPMKMKMDMGKLRNATGTGVDRMFLSMMVPHHASAILMADEALQTTGRAQLRGLAHNITDSQAKEIGDMREMYHRHFGKM